MKLFTVSRLITATFYNSSIFIAKRATLAGPAAVLDGTSGCGGDVYTVTLRPVVGIKRDVLNVVPIPALTGPTGGDVRGRAG